MRPFKVGDEVEIVRQASKNTPSFYINKIGIITRIIPKLNNNEPIYYTVAFKYINSDRTEIATFYESELQYHVFFKENDFETV
jgi:hypothetical protein